MPPDDIRTIVLTQNTTAIVDAEDYEWLTALGSWSAHDEGYAVRRGPGKLVYMQRLLMGVDDPERRVIHRNGNRLDNRKANLLVVTPTEAAHHAKPTTEILGQPPTSKHKGVYFEKSRSKWVAQITYNGRNKRVGSFDTERQAAEAYNAEARRLYGELAYINDV